MSAATEWRALLDEFPARCVTSAALRRRKRWRKKCARLCAAQNGLPPEVRRDVWARMLAAAAEAAPRITDAAPAPAPAPANDAAAPRIVGSSSRSLVPANEDSPRWARARRRSDDGRIAENIPREIALDVPRTLTGSGSADEATEDCGAGAKRLRRLLTHFARTAPPDQGYCQGLNFLGSTLLRVFDADRDPRATTVDARGALAFRGLVALVAPLYAPDFRGLRELVAVAGAVLPAYAPRLAALLRDEDLDLMPIVSSWVLALFAATPMPPQNVLVCWDLLLLGTPSRRELSLERCAGGRPRDRDTGSGSDDAAGAPALFARPRAAARRFLRLGSIEDAAAEKMGASAKRHVVLLRLCLVMLRVGEERIGDAADGLDALSRLGAAWFPATPPDLCSRFLACEIRSKPIRAAARRHRRDRAREKRAKQGLPPRPPGALARLRALLSLDPGTTL